jgi:23S rRNA (guanine2445-N2)-methyltransferase / 23S rRNA (guanine2069-N7)-methyltransferase
MARYHAERAGVDDDIHFQERTFDRLTSKREYGCVITNPPYGERLGEQEAAEELHRSIPEVLRNLPTWSHYVLTALSDFEQLIGRRADRRRKLYNGRIECTYYQFHGPKPGTARKHTPVSPDAGVDLDTPPKPAPPVLRAFGGITAKGHEQAELFKARLRKRARHLRRWPSRRDIHCFRLYERDIPEIPLIVDRYDDHLHLTEYERPHDRDIAQHAEWLDLMKRSAAEALDVEPAKVFLKHKHRQRDNMQHEKTDAARYEIVVREGGLRFWANLSDYVDTGLFLDHRITRSIVRDDAKDQRVLNLFAYTGAFSVYAAAGGAKSVTTVDWSATYLDWARRNFDLNGLKNPHFDFVRNDARDYLAQLKSHDQFDIAVVDPPTFSNSKRTDDDWDVQRDHAKLIKSVLAHITSGGRVYFSTNFRRFKLYEDNILATSIREISRQTVPEDFRNRRIHRCWVIEK